LSTTLLLSPYSYSITVVWRVSPLPLMSRSAAIIASVGLWISFFGECYSVGTGAEYAQVLPVFELR